jgi:hypothetical protein
MPYALYTLMLDDLCSMLIVEIAIVPHVQYPKLSNRAVMLCNLHVYEGRMLTLLNFGEFAQKSDD